MRKLLITMMCVIMVIAMMPAIAFAEEVTALAGSGSEADPYLISTIDELKFFRDSVNAGETTYNAEGVYVALGADIDMAGEDWSVNIGDDCNATFDGIFDGKDYTIYNLTSTEAAQKADGYICTGLFGAIYGSAVVKNFTIENATIDTGDYTGNNAGVVVGFAYNATGSIENVHVTGNVTVNADKVDGTGAIVGYAYSGSLTIEGCSVETSVINGQAYVGGIIGYAGGMTTVTGCSVSDTDVNASSCIAGGAGGFIAAGGVVSDCSIESVDLTAAHENWKASAAAVVGSNGGSLYISDCTITDVTANTEPTDMELGCKWVNHPTEAVPGYEAKIDGNYYTSLEDAVDAVESGETITLLTDTEKTVEVPLGVTLDTNGKTAENVTLVPGVASINGVNYGTLQAALDAANAAPGDYEIVLASGNLDEDVIIHQTEGVNVTIKGNKVDTVYTGHMEIYGHARYNDAETLTIDGVVFTTEEDSHTFIEQNTTDSEKRYPHNVTIKNCSFAGTGAGSSVIGMKFRQGYNIKVENVTAENMHSLMQADSCSGIAFDGITITESGRGMSLGTSLDVTVKDAEISVNKYGVRLDADAETTAVVENSEIDAFIPVVVREAKAEYELVFNGTNTMTATNTDGIWCAIGTSEYEENGKMPTAPSGNIDVRLNDATLPTEGVYGIEEEKIINPSIGGGIHVDTTVTNGEAGICFEALDVQAGDTVKVELYADATKLVTKQFTFTEGGTKTCTFYTVGTSSSWTQIPSPWKAYDHIVPTHAVLYINDVEIGTDAVEFTIDEWEAFPGTLESSIDGGILVDTTATNGEAGICFEAVNVADNDTVKVELYAGTEKLVTKQFTFTEGGTITCTFYTVGTSSSWTQTPSPWKAYDCKMPTHAVLYLNGTEIGSDDVEFTTQAWEAFAGTNAHVYENGTCTICGGADPNYVPPTTPTYTPSVTIQKPVIESAENATVTLGILGNTATIAPSEGYEIADVTVNGVSKGAVTSLFGLKTGDKIVVITKAIEAPKTEAQLIQEALDEMALVARSKRTTSPSGKKSIMVYWYDKAGAELDFDGVEIFRSTKKNSGYKKVFTSKTDKYYNTAIEEGVKYYYRVRGYVTVDGEKLYTDWSLKAIRTAK